MRQYPACCIQRLHFLQLMFLREPVLRDLWQSLAKIGSLSNSGEIAIPATALDAFQLVFKSQTTGATLYDSGTRAKGANTVFIVASLPLNQPVGLFLL
jgi:hypothetical protein